MMIIITNKQNKVKKSEREIHLCLGRRFFLIFRRAVVDGPDDGIRDGVRSVTSLGTGPSRHGETENALLRKTKSRKRKPERDRRNRD